MPVYAPPTERTGLYKLSTHALTTELSSVGGALDGAPSQVRGGSGARHRLHRHPPHRPRRPQGLRGKAYTGAPRSAETATPPPRAATGP
jgi:hypothetical protein